MQKALEERLIDLETRLAFQEDTLQQLNDVLVEQGRRVDLLRDRLTQAEERLRTLQPSLLGRIEEEPPPPHY